MFSYHKGIKVGISNRKILRKSHPQSLENWKLKLTFLNNPREIRKYTELNEMKTQHQNLWDALLRRKILTVNTYIDLNFHLIKICTRLYTKNLRKKES